MKDKAAGTFSGGMKRRLSVAMAVIGDPRVIFMDEPTTGMDPVNRKEVWGVIERLKRGRAVVLTTHSMEEADTLGDRVAIMAAGRVRCLGNPLHLKNLHGKGYRVNLVLVQASSAEVLLAHVKTLLPTATVGRQDGNSLILQVHLL